MTCAKKQRGVTASEEKAGVLAACRRWTRGAVCGWCHGSPAPGSAASLPTISQCGSVQCWDPGEEREEVCGAVAAAAPAAGKPRAPRETLHPSLRRGLFRLQGGCEKGCGLQLAVESKSSHDSSKRRRRVQSWRSSRQQGVVGSF